MKIVAVCGQGLGSSLIIEMNIKDVVEELGIDAEVTHTNLNSFNASEETDSVVVCGADLADSIEFDKKIVLDNLFDKEQLKEKISNYFNV